MNGDARAFWTVGPGLGEIRDERLASPAPGDVVVRARYSGISRGTEALVFHGHVPPSEYQRMRAPFQAGTLPWPVKYGYASVGEVDAGPASLAGRTVFVLYPHQTRYVVPAEAVHIVPPGIPARRAVLAANMETALNGLWDAAVRPGDRVAVVGGGTVGCLAAWLAGRMPGCEVELVDICPHRASIAAGLGVAFATPETARVGADVVVHASGTAAGLDVALRLAGDETVITDLSWYGDQSVSLPLGAAFHACRLTIRSSQVGRVATAQRARWTTRRRMALAIALLADPALDVLVTGESTFDALPQTMVALTREPGPTVCHVVRYPG